MLSPVQDKEEYREIPGFPDYRVSQFGRIKSYKSDPDGRHMVLKKTPWGYLKVQCSMGKRGVKKFPVVHRLVALAWIPKEEGREQVNHKDCNKTNNAVSNLEWVNRKENAEHAKRMGRYLPTTGDNHWTRRQPERLRRGNQNHKSRISHADAVRIKYELPDWSCTKLAEMYGVSTPSIIAIRNGSNWKHI